MRLLITYHSMTGGTRQMAQAAADGAAAEPGVEALLQRAQDTHAADVLDADGYLFATPEYSGGMSGLMKDFFDRTWYPVHGRVPGRPYATLVCAGNDGTGAARQVERIVTGWRLRCVASPLIVCTHAQTPEAILAPKSIVATDRARCAELGAALATGLQLGVF